MKEYEIFCEAMDVDDPALRQEFLDRSCGPDQALRQRVEALLAAQADPNSLLEIEAVAGIREEMKAVLVTDLAREAEAFATSGNHEASPSNLDVDVLQFLEPSPHAGSLGRIGHYEVQAIIGRGGCGVVMRGHDAKLHRTVAIKMIAPELAGTSPARQRFLREARAAAAVTHQNVVRIYSVEAEPRPYLVMEYVAGDSLQQRLDESGPFSIEEVSHWGLQIAQGLAASHAQGVIHRDMKPSNILLDTMTNQIKITDFGLARTADDACLTRSGVIAGTPLYMSPEQAQGLTVDHRSDLFSLGSVLYALCSGRPPFRAASTIAILRRVVEDQPRPLQEIIPELPTWLVSLISKLHAKDPDARFPSAAYVVRIWEATLRQSTTNTIATLPPPNPEVLDPRKPLVSSTFPRLPPWATMVLLAMFLVAAASVASYFRPGSSFSGVSTNSQVAHGSSSTSPSASESQVPSATAQTSVRRSAFKEIHGATEDQIQAWAASLGKQQVDADRRSAEYVLSIGGIVGLHGIKDEIRAVVDLPQEPFELTSIGLNGNRLVTDEGLASCTGCTNLQRLDLVYTPITDAGLRHFAGNKKCEVLYLAQSSISDTGLAVFQGNTKLRELWLGDTQLTDNGLVYFKDCKDLTKLWLGGTQITDAGLVHFQDCRNLLDLSLMYTSVTDNGLANFRNCKNLEVLWLGNTDLTDMGLAHIEDCERLKEVYLDRTKFSDAGLVYLKNAKNLSTLSLTQTVVTDSGLAALKQHKNLMYLYLQKTNVTVDGISELRKALPACMVEWDGG